MHQRVGLEICIKYFVEKILIFHFSCDVCYKSRIMKEKQKFGAEKVKHPVKQGSIQYCQSLKKYCSEHQLISILTPVNVVGCFCIKFPKKKIK